MVKRGMGELLDLNAIEPVLLYFRRFCKEFKFIFPSLGFIFTGEQRLITHPKGLSQNGNFWQCTVNIVI